MGTRRSVARYVRSLCTTRAIPPRVSGRGPRRPNAVSTPYALGPSDQSIVSKTTDGGTTWTSQPDDSQTTAVTHLRMRLIGHHPFEQLGGVWPDLLCPLHHARRWPVQMSLVTLGPVHPNCDCLSPAATAQVLCHPRALVQDLHRRGRRADLDHLMHQVVGNAVQVVHRTPRDSRC